MKIKKLLTLTLVLLLSCFALFGCEIAPSPASTDSDSTPKEEQPSKVYSDNAQVVILLGQSNAAGCSQSYYLDKTVSKEKYDEYSKGYSKVKMSFVADGYNSSGAFVRVKLGLANTVASFGPEVGIAETISEVDPTDRVFIIKYAHGGTRLTNRWKSPSTGNAGDLYNGAVKYIHNQLEALENMGLTPTIQAICWMQGESDADADAPYNLYETYESLFISDLRSEFLAYKPFSKKIGFVDAAISDSKPWVHYKEINQAKYNLSQKDPENHIYLDTIAAKLTYNLEPTETPDLYHYDSASMIKLGQMFGKALLDNFITY